jgi:hypothetical protein
MKNKVIDLQEYKKQQELKNQLDKLDRLAEEQYPNLSPEEQKGFRNLMRLLEGLDAKFSPNRGD